jgi:hypothetical protein
MDGHDTIRALIRSTRRTNTDTGGIFTVLALLGFGDFEQARPITLEFLVEPVAAFAERD